MLNETFGQFAKKILSKPKAVFNRFIKGTIKIPSIPPERLAKFGNRVDNEFFKSYKLAQKVLQNSVNKVSDQQIIDWIALVSVIRGIALKSGKGLMYGTREA